MQLNTVQPAVPTQSPVSPARRKLYSGIHQAAKACGLEGEGYNLALLGLTGSKTATTLSDAQIRDATWEFWRLAQEKNRTDPKFSTAALEQEFGL